MGSQELGGEQRVTNALLSQKLDSLMLMMERHASNDERIWDDYGRRIGLLELGAATRQVEINALRRSTDNLDQQIESVKSRDFWAGGISTIAASIIASIVALFKP